jgi:hypothetical protein
MERNLRGKLKEEYCSGSGELGGDMSSYAEGEVAEGLSLL